MKLEISEQESIIILNIVGNLDKINAEKFEKKAMQILENHGKIIFLMDSCEHVSEEGIKALVEIAKYIKKRRAIGVLCGLIDEAWDVIDLVGFSHILPNCKDLDNAIKTLKGEKNAKNRYVPNA